MSQIKEEYQWQRWLENILNVNKKFQTKSVESINQEQQDDEMIDISDDNDFFDDLQNLKLHQFMNGKI